MIRNIPMKDGSWAWGKPGEETYQLRFPNSLPTKEIEDLLFWATYDTRLEMGKEKTKTDLHFQFDRHARILFVNRTNDVGRWFVARINKFVDKDTSGQMR